MKFFVLSDLQLLSLNRVCTILKLRFTDCIAELYFAGIVDNRLSSMFEQWENAE